MNRLEISDDVHTAAEAIARRRRLKKIFRTLAPRVQPPPPPTPHQPPPAPTVPPILAACKSWIAERLTLLPPQPRWRVPIEVIKRVVAHRFNVSQLDLESRRRTRDVTRPRQLAIYLARHHTNRSFPQIGLFFGGRDHTTVLHSVRLVEQHLEAGDEQLAAVIAELRRDLGVTSS